MLLTINESATYLLNKTNLKPEIGIVLGTGLGDLANKISITHSFDYSSIPNFPVSTVEGHHGRLIFGNLAGKSVVVMQGRFHYYEGYSMQEVTFPIRVMKMLGIQYLVVSNASGGLNPAFSVGDLMIITDHINLFKDHPLIGKNEDALGPRFPDMSQVYNKSLIEKALHIAKENDIKIYTGVYVGVTGPTFETPAEYNYLRLIGGDAVGMSTVPEIIVARHMDIPCFAISVITDSGVPGQIIEISHAEVQVAARKAQPLMSRIVSELIRSL